MQRKNFLCRHCFRFIQDGQRVKNQEGNRRDGNKQNSAPAHTGTLSEEIMREDGKLYLGRIKILEFRSLENGIH